MGDTTVINMTSKSEHIFAVIGRAFVYWRLGKLAYNAGKAIGVSTPSNPTSRRTDCGEDNA